ncbi:unnamed protein product [Discula destructiva]
MRQPTFLSALHCAAIAHGQVIEKCPGFESASNIACVAQHAAVLAPPFSRGGILDTFVRTKVPSDPSFSRLANVSFVIFSEAEGVPLLGSSPKVEKVFTTRNDSIHEAPVYVPGLNVIIFSQPRAGIYTQQLINLNATPPTLEAYTTHPPVYAVNGGTLHGGKVYWASEASFPFPNPSDGTLTQQAPGIYELDPMTNVTRVLVNNYYGTLFNSPNDLWVDRNGDIFFTDSWYGWGINVTAYPVHRPATYRLRPSTGAVSIVEDSLGQPNGIAMSRDGKTLYISDTGVTDFFNVSVDQIPRYKVDPFGGSSVYAFDVVSAPRGDYLTNKRPIYLPQSYVVDGMHVSREGYILGAAGSGVDVLNACGELLLRIELPLIVNSLQFAGPDREDIWAFGPGGVFRITGLDGIHGKLDA